MIFIKKTYVLRQYFIVIAANFTLFHLGLNIGWLSPVMVMLRDANQTVLPEPIGEEDMSWVVSVSSIVDCFAICFSGYLANNLGRKYSIILTTLPRVVVSLLYIYASQVWMLILARSITGLSDAFGVTVAATYSSEIASKEIRGGLGTITQIFSTLGSMVAFSVGPYVSYNTINVMIFAVIMITTIPFFFIPESPYFLYSQGKTEEAIKVLRNLREDEMTIFDEIKQYSMSIESKLDKKEILRDKIILITLFKIAIFAALSQMTGFSAVMVHLQSIFKLTNTSLSSETSSVITGVFSVLSCLGTIFLTDKFGRKPVLIISLLGLGLGMVGIGTFFKLTEDSVIITGFLNYLPILSMIIILYGYNAGIGSIMWSLFAELFEGPLRAFGVSLGLSMACFMTFVTTRYLNTLMHVLGSAITYWMFGGFCGLLCLFIMFFIPETKGKTFRQIQTDLGKYQIENEVALEGNMDVK